MNRIQNWLLFQALVARILGEEEKKRVVARIEVTAEKTRTGYENYRPVSPQTPRDAPRFFALHFKVQLLRLEQLMVIHVSILFDNSEILQLKLLL